MHLQRILETTRASVARRKRKVRVETLLERAAKHSPRGFVQALRARQDAPAIIAELKKASPSKGLIRENFDTAALAQSFESSGAAALSVLTNAPYFQGSLHNLETASSVTALPCLRKDFIVSDYQIVEARAHCADAILLIAAALSDADLERFTGAARRYGLDVLCEVHSAQELERVRGLGCDAYGVNNRNLDTFEVNLETSLRLVDRMPAKALRVAESGINTAEDIEHLRAAGFDAFLVGESLMRQADPGAALQALLAPLAERV